MRVTVNSFRRIAIVAVATAPIGLLGAAGIARVKAQPPSSPGELSGKKFKNIKVLKNLPADKLIPTMHEWSASLAVKCDFCHIINADHTGFERDDKPTKETARAMLTMVMDLNKHQKILDKKATCFLCHHGHAEPQNHPEDAETKPQ